MTGGVVPVPLEFASSRPTARGGLRVLVISYEFPPIGGGGGRVAASIARGLARRGFTVRVLTSRLRGLPNEERLDGIDIRRAFAGRRQRDRCTALEMAAYVISHIVPALSEVRRFHPDVVHVHFAVPSGAVAWFATRLRRVPYVLTAHLGDVPGGAPEQTDQLFGLVKPMTIPIWRGAVAVTAVASHVSRLAHTAYGCHPTVILNGIDMRRPLPAIPRPSGAPVRAIWSGRIQTQKNLSAGIKALAAITDRAWTLDIIGDGPLRQEVEQCAHSSGLNNRVRFRGWLCAADVEKALAAADILFLPSLSEGLSLATVEALRAGLAIVATRIPGINDVVIDGVNGLLCDPRQPETYASALATLVDDPDRLDAMRRASIARAPLFDEERMIDAYEVVLRDAAGGERQ